MAFDEDVPLAANQIAADLVSLNANMEFIISGDGTAGRVLRYSRLDVAYSATADSIQCYLADQWNGDDIDSSGSPHTITKSDSDTDWALNAGGTSLTIEAAGITGNAIAAIASVCYNKGGEGPIYVRAGITSNDIVLEFFKSHAGAVYDITALASGESIQIDILYITSA